MSLGVVQWACARALTGAKSFVFNEGLTKVGASDLSDQGQGLFTHAHDYDDPWCSRVSGATTPGYVSRANIKTTS